MMPSAVCAWGRKEGGENVDGHDDDDGSTPAATEDFI